MTGNSKIGQINRNLFLCSECKSDTSLTREGGPQPHAVNCSRRGAHVSSLTVDSREPSCGWVAQCRDGHPFWEGERRTDPNWVVQQFGAELDVKAHNAEVHSERDALGAAYRMGWDAPTYKNPWNEPFPEPPVQPPIEIDAKRIANREAAEIGIAGTWISNLAMDGKFTDRPEQVVMTGEEDGGWWFYLPDTWPNERWRGDIRWYAKSTGLFIPDGNGVQPHPFHASVSEDGDSRAEVAAAQVICSECGLPSVYYVHDDPREGQDFDWSPSDELPPGFKEFVTGTPPLRLVEPDEVTAEEVGEDG
jgi:hypothetical protein